MTNIAYLIQAAAKDRRKRIFWRYKQMFRDAVADIMPRVERVYEQKHGYVGDSCDYQAWMEVLGLSSEDEAEEFVNRMQKFIEEREKAKK